jgi:hypothetical protein
MESDNAQHRIAFYFTVLQSQLVKVLLLLLQMSIQYFLKRSYGFASLITVVAVWVVEGFCRF